MNSDIKNTACLNIYIPLTSLFKDEVCNFSNIKLINAATLS